MKLLLHLIVIVGSWMLIACNVQRRNVAASSIDVQRYLNSTSIEDYARRNIASSQISSSSIKNGHIYVKIYDTSRPRDSVTQTHPLLAEATIDLNEDLQQQTKTEEEEDETDTRQTITSQSADSIAVINTEQTSKTINTIHKNLLLILLLLLVLLGTFLLIKKALRK